MVASIVSNPAALVAQRNLSRSSGAVASSIARLSSGNRIVSAKDDAAALAIGAKLTAEVSGYKQAKINAGQAQAMLQIADGAMSNVSDILVRMKTLAVQASSGQLSSGDRTRLNKEYSALLTEIDRIANDTQFNGTDMINGAQGLANVGNSLSNTATSFDGADGITAIDITGEAFTGTNTYIVAYDATGGDTEKEFTVTLASADQDAGEATVFKGSVKTAGFTGAVELYGVDGDGDERMYITVTAAFDDTADLAGTTAQLSFDVTGSNQTTFSYKVGTGTVGAEDNISVNLESITASRLGVSGGDILNVTNAETAITNVDTAIDNLAQYRAQLGADQSTFDFAVANLDSIIENSEAARSALLDTDVASEITMLTSKQVLVQSGISMLAQAQSVQQNLVQLLQG